MTSYVINGLLLPFQVMFTITIFHFLPSWNEKKKNSLLINMTLFFTIYQFTVETISRQFIQNIVFHPPTFAGLETSSKK